MIFTLILVVIGLMVLYRFLVMCFWCVAWLMIIQPLRLALYLCGAIFAPPVAPVPTNVIPFPRRIIR